jgi:hypothetical protein
LYRTNTKLGMNFCKAKGTVHSKVHMNEKEKHCKEL